MAPRKPAPTLARDVVARRPRTFLVRRRAVATPGPAAPPCRDGAFGSPHSLACAGRGRRCPRAGQLFLRQSRGAAVAPQQLRKGTGAIERRTRIAHTRRHGLGPPEVMSATVDISWCLFDRYGLDDSRTRTISQADMPPSELMKVPPKVPVVPVLGRRWVPNWRHCEPIRRLCHPGDSSVGDRGRVRAIRETRDERMSAACRCATLYLGCQYASLSF